MPTTSLDILIDRFGLSCADARNLRRQARRLSTWDLHECNGTIQRDEATGVPYWRSPHSGKRMGRTPDREKGAMRIATEIAEKYGLCLYRQGDPRGASLHLYAPADLQAYRRRVGWPFGVGPGIDSCYSSVAVAVY